MYEAATPSTIIRFFFHRLNTCFFLVCAPCPIHRWTEGLLGGHQHGINIHQQLSTFFCQPAMERRKRRCILFNIRCVTTEITPFVPSYLSILLQCFAETHLPLAALTMGIAMLCLCCSGVFGGTPTATQGIISVSLFSFGGVLEKAVPVHVNRRQFPSSAVCMQRLLHKNSRDLFRLGYECNRRELLQQADTCEQVEERFDSFIIFATGSFGGPGASVQQDGTSGPYAQHTSTVVVKPPHRGVVHKNLGRVSLPHFILLLFVQVAMHTVQRKKEEASLIHLFCIAQQNHFKCRPFEPLHIFRCTASKCSLRTWPLLKHILQWT